ncbi:hypothetical protein EBZ39_17055 [bacterium]|nr:hypothetical protein [bacterium]
MRAKREGWWVPEWPWGFCFGLVGAGHSRTGASIFLLMVGLGALSGADYHAAPDSGFGRPKIA